jgi:hypothetical protein
MNDEIPERKWELSAPESQVLLWGAETSDAWALKPALLELVVRRVLRLGSVEDRRYFLFPTVVNVLSRGPGEVPDDCRALEVVVAAKPASLRSYSGGIQGVSVEKLAQEVFRRYLRRVRVRTGVFRWQRTEAGYVRSEVLPELERRGLYARERPERGVAERWTLTLRGKTALADLRTLMAIGRGSFGAWVDHDPARAAACVERAGTALLLIGGLGPSLERLAQWEANGGAAGRMPDDTADAFRAGALAGTFGPGPFDGLDAAAFTIGEAVDRAWDELHRRGGGLVVAAGE